ncbi:MAG: DUF6537 domain-containing protein, partial [Candidatus Dormibacteria bacterium]
VYHLHPPMLRALGLKRKLRFGGWFTPVLRTLAAAKGVRGTPFDIFGYAKIRREERRLVGWYRELIETSLARLNPATAPMVVSIARIPDDIRGYESIKLRSIVAAEVHARELLESLPS